MRNNTENQRRYRQRQRAAGRREIKLNLSESSLKYYDTLPRATLAKVLESRLNTITTIRETLALCDSIDKTTQDYLIDCLTDWEDADRLKSSPTPIENGKLDKIDWVLAEVKKSLLPSENELSLIKCIHKTNTKK